MLYYDEDIKRAEVSCDKCPTTRIINGVADFKFLIEMLKEDAWIMIKPGEIPNWVVYDYLRPPYTDAKDWEHFCPKCATKLLRSYTPKVKEKKDAKKHRKNC